MSKRVNKLLGLEFDEVSLVDRPANQLGLVTITKRDEGPVDDIFDAEGNPIDPATLQPGDYFYSEDGDEFRALTEDQVGWLEEQGIEIPDDLSQLDELGLFEEEGAREEELAGVGKSAASAITGGASSLVQTGRKIGDKTLGSLKSGYFHATTGAATRTSDVNEHAARLGAAVGRNRGAVGAGAGAGAGGFMAGHHRGRRTATSKSLGQELLTELSKAYTDGDRDTVVSKAIEAADRRAEAAERRANVAISKAERVELERETEAYVELAKSYELPVDPEDLGPILQTIAKSGLSREQLDTVDRIFTAAGEQALYAEVGTGGVAPSSILEAAQAQAYEIVGKADASVEAATAAVFDANPDAYLEYLAETGH